MAELDYFLHPDARCETQSVGSGTRIWAFAHVLPGARIGRECNICDGVFIENDVVLGDRVTVKCGVQLWDGVRVGDDVLIGPNATFTNDPFPRSRHYPEQFLETRIEQGASIGANATILPGLTIGRHAMVGAGAVVTHDVPPRALVVGNPARVVRYIDAERQPLPNRLYDLEAETPPPAKALPSLADCSLVPLPTHPDAERGTLTALQVGDQLPFQPGRIFFLEGTPPGGRRGGHAHRASDELVVSLRGAITVRLWDGREDREFRLDSSSQGLYLPPMIWIDIYDFTSDSLTLAIASHAYDPADYLYDKEAYRSMMTDDTAR
jgi:acetyltransferase-like isoleucine patch superfamily enzyme/dTDP-4-dehydrorhamnose 3,5-epimerase-like enzyme